jgi:hypothetical protein
LGSSELIQTPGNNSRRVGADSLIQSIFRANDRALPPLQQATGPARLSPNRLPEAPVTPRPALWTSEQLIAEAGGVGPKEDRLGGLWKMSEKYKAVTDGLKNIHVDLAGPIPADGPAARAQTANLLAQLKTVQAAIDTYVQAHPRNEPARAMVVLRTRIDDEIGALNLISRAPTRMAGMPWSEALAFGTIAESILSRPSTPGDPTAAATAAARLDKLVGLVQTAGGDISPAGAALLQASVKAASLAVVTERMAVATGDLLGSVIPPDGEPATALRPLIAQGHDNALLRAELIDQQALAHKNGHEFLQEKYTALLEMMGPPAGIPDKISRELSASVAALRTDQPALEPTALFNHQINGLTALRSAVSGVSLPGVDFAPNRQEIDTALKAARSDHTLAVSALSLHQTTALLLPHDTAGEKLADVLAAHQNHAAWLGDADAAPPTAHLEATPPTGLGRLISQNRGQMEMLAAKLNTDVADRLAGIPGEARHLPAQRAFVDQLDSAIQAAAGKALSPFTATTVTLVTEKRAAVIAAQNQLTASHGAWRQEARDLLVAAENQGRGTLGLTEVGTTAALLEKIDLKLKAMEGNGAIYAELGSRLGGARAALVTTLTACIQDSLSSTAPVNAQITQLSRLLQALPPAAAGEVADLHQQVHAKMVGLYTEHQVTVLTELQTSFESAQNIVGAGDGRKTTALLNLLRSVERAQTFDPALAVTDDNQLSTEARATSTALGALHQAVRESAVAGVTEFSRTIGLELGRRGAATPNIRLLATQLDALFPPRAEAGAPADPTGKASRLRQGLNELQLWDAKQRFSLQAPILKIITKADTLVTVAPQLSADGEVSIRGRTKASAVSKNQGEDALRTLYRLGMLDLPGFAGKIERFVDNRPSLQVLVEVAQGNPIMIDALLGEPEWDDAALRLKKSVVDPLAGDAALQLGKIELAHELNIGKRTLDQLLRESNPDWRPAAPSGDAATALGLRSFGYDATTVAAFMSAAASRTGPQLDQVKLLLAQVVVLSARIEFPEGVIPEEQKAHTAELVRTILGRPAGESADQVLATAGLGHSFASVSALRETTEALHDLQQMVAQNETTVADALAAFDRKAGDERGTANGLVSRAAIWSLTEPHAAGITLEPERRLYREAWANAGELANAKLGDKIERRLARIDNYLNHQEVGTASFRDPAAKLNQLGLGTELTYYFGVKGAQINGLADTTIHLEKIAELRDAVTGERRAELATIIGRNAANPDQLLLSGENGRQAREVTRSNLSAFRTSLQPKTAVGRALSNSNPSKQSLDKAAQALATALGATPADPVQVRRACAQLGALLQLGEAHDAIKTTVQEIGKFRKLRADHDTVQKFAAVEAAKINRDAPHLARVATAVMLDVFSQSSFQTLTAFKTELGRPGNELETQLKARLAAIGLDQIPGPSGSARLIASQEMVSWLRLTLEAKPNLLDLLKDEFSDLEKRIEQAPSQSRPQLKALIPNASDNFRGKICQMAEGQSLEVTVSRKGGLNISVPVATPGVNATFGFALNRSNGVHIQRETGGNWTVVCKSGEEATGRAGVKTLGGLLSANLSLGAQQAKGFIFEFEAQADPAKIARLVEQFFKPQESSDPLATLRDAGATRILGLDAGGASIGVEANLKVNAEGPSDLFLISASARAGAEARITQRVEANSFEHRQISERAYELKAGVQVNLSLGGVDAAGVVQAARAAQTARDRGDGTVAAGRAAEAAYTQSGKVREKAEAAAEQDESASTAPDRADSSLLAAEVTYAVQKQEQLVSRLGALTTATCKRSSLQIGGVARSAGQVIAASTHFERMKATLGIPPASLAGNEAFQDALQRIQTLAANGHAPQMSVQWNLTERAALLVNQARSARDPSEANRLLDAPDSYEMSQIEILVRVDPATSGANGKSVSLKTGEDIQENLQQKREGLANGKGFAVAVFGGAAVGAADLGLQLAEVGVTAGMDLVSETIGHVSLHYAKSAEFSGAQKYVLPLGQFRSGP